MRSAIITNTAVGAANGVTNPQAASASATLSTATQSASQNSQLAAAQSTKILASERSVSIEKKTEGSFDSQKNDPDRDEGQIESRRERTSSEQGNLLAVA